METTTPFDWHRIFIGEEPVLFYLEIIFRVVLVYGYSVLLVRLMGKRGSQALSPLENMVIIALGSAVGDTMFYPEVPLTYAFLIVTLIVGMSRGMAKLQTYSEDFNDFMDGKPLLIIQEGQLIREAMPRTRLRDDELYALLRIQGIEDLAQVRLAWYERTGELSVFKYCGDDVLPQGQTTAPKHAEMA